MELTPFSVPYIYVCVLLQIKGIRTGYVDKRLHIYLLSLMNDRPFWLLEIIVTQSSVFHTNC